MPLFFQSFFQFVGGVWSFFFYFVFTMGDNIMEDEKSNLEERLLPLSLSKFLCPERANKNFPFNKN
jgi:hypothetical protein